jgi:leader peptidase (prepilin peptidase)/N-methyltransferase
MIVMGETSWMVASIVLGLLVGSFLNVLIHRLPRMVEELLDETIDPGVEGDSHGASVFPGPPPSSSLSLSAPASHCPNCGHRVRVTENIPVLSYVLLKGRCSACDWAIPIRYPVVEILGGAGALGCVLALGATPQGLAVMVFVWFAIAIAFIDMDHLLVPDLLSFSLLWTGLAVNATGLFVAPGDAIFGAMMGYLSFWVINAVATRVLGRAAIGEGDFKLFAAIGAWLGWQALAPSLLIASAIGAGIGYGLIWSGRMEKGRPICFAPFLVTGALVVLLSDGGVMNWLHGTLIR